MNNCFELLCCPICQNGLKQVGKSLKCERNHSFDMAKEGYVNLLMSRKKLAATVGDDGEMLRARRRFLDGGFYAPLADAIGKIAVSHLSRYANRDKSLNILDVGCGEGYYTEQLQKSFLERLPNQPVCFYGMDIAKTAVKMAAKRVERNGRFFVADINQQLPLPDRSLHLMLNIFAPRHAQEFARMMVTGGLLLIVIPSQQHLNSIRTQFDLLKIESNKQAHIETQLSACYSLREVSDLSIDLLLDQTILTDLIQMTPNARHLTSRQWNEISAINQIKTQASFHILSFIRK